MIVTKSKRNKWQETERKKHIVDQALLFLYTMDFTLENFSPYFPLFARDKSFFDFRFFCPAQRKIDKKTSDCVNK